MNRYPILAFAAVLATTLSACTTRPTKQQVDIGVGAGTGGLVGAAVFGGPIGIAASAAGGGLIGHEVAKK